MIATHKYPHPLFVFYISRSGIIQKYSFMEAVWIERYLSGRLKDLLVIQLEKRSSLNQLPLLVYSKQNAIYNFCLGRGGREGKSALKERESVILHN